MEPPASYNIPMAKGYAKKRGPKKRGAKKRDSEATREWIVERTAKLLNTGGYLHTPISEIMRVTGLKKGGIYHHFESREALALEAFQHSSRLLGARILQMIRSRTSAKDKLLGLIRFPFEDDYWRGGCPIANLAIESDDANPKLRVAARGAMDWLIGLFVQVIQEGMKQGEFAKGDAPACAVRMVAALEGGIVLSNLYKDLKYLQGIADRLEAKVRAGLPV